MYSYYLDDTPINAPVGLDAITLSKARHLRYWGFLYQKQGYIEDLTDFQFEEPEAVRLLRSRFDRYGIEAVTRFRIADGGRVLYDGFVDYSSYVFDGERVTVAFGDSQAVVSLETQATTSYSTILPERLSLKARRIGGLVQMLTDPTALVIQKSSPSPVFINHSVPLTRRNEKDDTVSGTLVPVITPAANDPFYRNTTTVDQVMQLTGAIAVRALSTTSLNAELIASALDASGTVVSTTSIARFLVNATANLLQPVVRLDVVVPPGGSLRLGWNSPTTTNKYIFVYQESTVLAVTDESGKPGSTCQAIRAIDLFRALVSKSTAGALAARSHFFESGEGLGCMLTTGAAIRGIERPLTTSLQDFFEGLSRYWNLAMWVDDKTGTVWIEPKTDLPKRRTRIKQVTVVRQQPAMDYIYSQVLTGSVTWKGDSLLAGEEPNSKRSYTTGIRSFRGTLDLVSNYLSASTLIEEQRRKQFDAKTASSGKVESLDNAVFVICARQSASGWVSETGRFFPYVGKVFEYETLHNVRISPRRCLERWGKWLQGSLPVSLESTEGGSSMVSEIDGLRLSESDPLTGDRSVPLLITLEAPMSMEDYDNLGEVIQIDAAGFQVEGWLLTAQWRQTENTEMATLTLLTQ